MRFGRLQLLRRVVSDALGVVIVVVVPCVVHMAVAMLLTTLMHLLSVTGMHLIMLNPE